MDFLRIHAKTKMNFPFIFDKPDTILINWFHNCFWFMNWINNSEIFAWYFCMKIFIGWTRYLFGIFTQSNDLLGNRAAMKSWTLSYSIGKGEILKSLFLFWWKIFHNSIIEFSFLGVRNKIFRRWCKMIRWRILRHFIPDLKPNLYDFQTL